MTKRIAKFITFKILEIGGFIAVLWAMNKILWYAGAMQVYWWPIQGGLFLIFTIPVCIILIVVVGLIWELIKKNWEWAGK